MNIKQGTLDLEFEEKQSGLTILSFGGGQDSTTILFLLVYDEKFRRTYIKKGGRLLVIFSDTHSEHPETYKYMDDVIEPFCKKHNIEFVRIENDMGYHGETWLSLTHQWDNKTPTVGSVAYPKSCSHNLKMAPQYRFVEDWLPANYPNIVNKRRKDNFVQFSKLYGRIIWLIGISRGEERRAYDAEKETARWKRLAIDVKYPLIDFKMDRQDCQDYIKDIKKPIPMPSNCMMCPFSSTHLELLWMEKSYPDKFEEWVEKEQNKLDYHIDAPRNLGVTGRVHKKGEKKGMAITLREVLSEAKIKYPDITLAELNEQKWSRGHCVSTAF